MLSDYIDAAMRRANYKLLPEDETFFGEISGFPGVWANAKTLEKCREELKEVLEGWILIGVAKHHSLPVLDGIQLSVEETV